MNPSIRGKIFLMLVISLGVLLCPGEESLSQEVQRVALFQDDFEDNVLDGWLLADAFNNFIMGDDSPWQILTSGENHYLKGSTHSFAMPSVDGFMDGWITAEFKLESGSGFHFNVRQSLYGWSQRYFIGINEGGIYLSKQHADNFYDLSAVDVNLNPGIWHTLKVVLEGANIQISINDSEEINYYDTDNPYLFGKVSIESLTDNRIDFDNLHTEVSQFFEVFQI